MSGQVVSAGCVAIRNAALLAAEAARADAVHDADVEFGETVAKLDECYRADLAEALRRRIAAVTPAHRAHNAAVKAAEQACR